MKKLLIIGALLIGAATSQAQTNSNWFFNLVGDVEVFFHDNTNFFNLGVVQLQAGPVLNVNGWKAGADVQLNFPVASQAAIGLDVLYYDNQAYAGTVNTTLGTTWSVPLIGPVYTYGQVGVGTELNNPQNVISEQWGGGKWMYSLNAQWSLFIDGAAGHLSNQSGALVRAMIGGQYTFGNGTGLLGMGSGHPYKLAPRYRH